jgi:ubiquinone/menaquinone biosynthesis C-methylase UbiE
MNSVTPEPIMKIAMGFMAAKHLFIASAIGLFEALGAGPASLEEIAQKTDVPVRTLGIIAAAMVSLGLIERQGDRYQNGVVAAAFLAGAGGPDMRPMLRFWNHISYPTWEKLEEAVRTGQSQAKFGGFSEQQQEIFSQGVESFSASTAAALAKTYDFGRHQRVLDVGGGTGSFLLAILQHHKNLTGTLFELPGACAVARRRLAMTPEASRIKVVEGSFLKDPLPGDHDVLVVANTVHVLSAAQNIKLMESMRGQVKAGARLLLADLWTDSTYTEPPAALLMSGEFLVISGEGQAYSEQDADGWLKQTGWRKIERKSLAGPASLIVAEAV